jgi:oxygen-independent coproporphyrinogen-3 oxidase
MDLYDPLWSHYLLSRGYERYEVSNFALPEARSRHNQVYWRNEDFLGLGPGAASSLHPLRWSNDRDTFRYMSSLSAGKSPRQHVERLTPTDRLLESLGIGLRTRDGLLVSELDRRFSEGWRLATARGLGELTQAGLVEEVSGRLRIPAEAMTRVDSITTALARAMD